MSTRKRSPTLPPIRPTCIHKKKNLKCHELTEMDVHQFHDAFYSLEGRKFQDSFLLKHMQITNVMRHRVPVDDLRNSRSECSTKYYVCNIVKKKIPVCVFAFSEILQVSRFRLNNIARQFHQKGYAEDRRGGFRLAQKYLEPKDKIRTFILQLTTKESHHCRGRTKRFYLPCDLSIAKLYRIFCEKSGHKNAKESYFRHIFHTEFNLAFGLPATDICCTCQSFEERIKNSTDENEKEELRTRNAIHKKRANAFFEYLSDTDQDLLLISFDCEKDHPLPKVPNSAAYFSRQIYVYNFTAVIGHSLVSLTRENVYCFCWTENEFKKDANVIASCIFHLLKNVPNLHKYKRVRLMADGCGGQNKNSIIITMCMYWLSVFAPSHITELTLIFPITGHSFLPADQIFGKIKRTVKKHSVIINPEEMLKIIGESGTVINVSETVRICDFKASMNGVIKKTESWPFQMSQSKRIILRKNVQTGQVLIVGEPHYNTDLSDVFYNIFMENKEPRDIRPAEIHEANNISKNKKTDVNALLINHFGSDWRSLSPLQFFVYLLDVAIEGEPEEEDDDVENPICEAVDELPELIV